MSTASIQQADLDQLRAEVSAQKRALLASLLVSAWMVEARDPYTGGHLWRVARMAHILALETGLPPKEACRIAMAGFLHDLGKVGIPDAVLRKPGRLTDDEFALIKTHPRVGARMVAGHPMAELVVGVIHHHHEMPNGKGYPMGLSGDFIPLDARLVGICDAFDAMTSTRPYRKGMPIEKSLQIIESELGQQFDQVLGSRFVALGRAGAFDAIVGHSDEGVPLGHCPACGPTLVRPRNARIGDHVACPACKAQFQWLVKDGQTHAEATQGESTPQEQEPLLDQLLIEDLVNDWADAIFSG